MTRGRKKNFALPPSRSLEQQRAFRARKAQYVADLEERCLKFEEENKALRQEVALLRASLPAQAAGTSNNPELIRASLELMDDLASTSASLARFQELAQSGGLPLPNPPPFISPSTAPAFHHSAPHFNSRSSDITDNDVRDSLSNSSDDLYSPDCCAGLLDCRSLVEEDDDLGHMPRTRTSGMRSTSQHDSHANHPTNGLSH